MTTSPPIHKSLVEKLEAAKLPEMESQLSEHRYAAKNFNNGLEHAKGLVREREATRPDIQETQNALRDALALIESFDAVEPRRTGRPGDHVDEVKAKLKTAIAAMGGLGDGGRADAGSIPAPSPSNQQREIRLQFEKWLDDHSTYKDGENDCWEFFQEVWELAQKAAPKPVPAGEMSYLKAKKLAFERIMGLAGMPDDATPEYDEWLFSKSYQEGWSEGYSRGLDVEPLKPVMSKQPIETAPKGIPVLVTGGIAMQKTGGEWFTGMEEPRYERPLQWQPKWWMPIPTDNDAPGVPYVD